MSHPSKSKGDRAEREAAALLAELSHGQWPVRRKLGAGRADDTGDLDGVPGTVVQVKDYAVLAAAIRSGLDGAERQRHNAREIWGVAMIRRPKVRGRANGDQWFIAMTPATFVDLVGAAMDR